MSWLVYVLGCLAALRSRMPLWDSSLHCYLQVMRSALRPCESGADSRLGKSRQNPGGMSMRGQRLKWSLLVHLCVAINAECKTARNRLAWHVCINVVEPKQEASRGYCWMFVCSRSGIYKWVLSHEGPGGQATTHICKCVAAAGSESC